MDLHEFRLEGEFIELNVLLKLLALASSGGGAKALIASGAVRVNGTSEIRIRRKLHIGDVVRVGGECVRIVAAA
ncbi:MAG: RNA-binding protein [Betaproteobacteria bacterium HGW-Betaproteobacteria-11]|nr:MAG: RNA-binding protein [Betaproteobacteria bacterium HGW-Betaproteobacteria-11]